VTTAVAPLRRKIERLFEWIAVALMALLAVEVLVGIAFRAARHPLVWYDEVASVLLAWLTYFGAALAALKRSHIGFPGLVNALGRTGRTITLAIREIAVIGFFALLAWEGTRILSLLGGETLVTIDIPVRLTQSVIPIGAVLFIVAELINLPDQIRWTRGAGAEGPAAAKELTH
jgi:TRAP-type C4-dicarboxylate transport system permease small subunit